MNSQIILGLWPIAGITTVGVTEADAQQTIAAAIDAGITRFDTAFSYGYDGESDRCLGRFVAQNRDRFWVMGKVGQRWTAERTRIVDGSSETLIADCENSLRRIGIDSFDALLLHSPDPNVPIEESAETLVKLMERGLCHRIGACNVSLAQHRQFAGVAPCRALQCPLNLLQQESLSELIPACRQNHCDVFVFWTLMKGLLAGKITRDHKFDPGDVRSSYEIFQGERRERAHRVLDGLADVAKDVSKTIAQLSIGWAIAQPGVSAALIGARRPQQIQETAQTTPLDRQTVARIDLLIKRATAA